VLLNHLWADLFRKCRYEVECFSTTSFWEDRLLRYARLHEGEMFLKEPVFSGVMGISVSQRCRLVSRCDHKTTKPLYANISL
jgi:hypothetical protein